MICFVDYTLQVLQLEVLKILIDFYLPTWIVNWFSSQFDSQLDFN